MNAATSQIAAKSNVSSTAYYAKRVSKLHRNGDLSGESISHQWIPLTKGRNIERVFMSWHHLAWPDNFLQLFPWYWPNQSCHACIPYGKRNYFLVTLIAVELSDCHESKVRSRRSCCKMGCYLRTLFRSTVIIDQETYQWPHMNIVVSQITNLSTVDCLFRGGGGLLSQFPPFRYFPIFSTPSSHTLAIKYHVYIWQVSPQLSFGGTCQI